MGAFKVPGAHLYSNSFSFGKVAFQCIIEGITLEPLLFCSERSQLKWFGQLARMSAGRLPGEVFRA